MKAFLALVEISIQAGCLSYAALCPLTTFTFGPVAKLELFESTKLKKGLQI